MVACQSELMSDRREGRVAVGGAAGESENLVVEGAAALIPEVVAGGEVEPVEVAAQIQVLSGLSMSWTKLSVEFMRL